MLNQRLFLKIDSFRRVGVSFNFDLCINLKEIAFRKARFKLIHEITPTYYIFQIVVLSMLLIKIQVETTQKPLAIKSLNFCYY